MLVVVVVLLVHAAGVGGLRLVCGCLFQVAPAWMVHSDDEL